jgi:thiamine monophosphate synthase
VAPAAHDRQEVIERAVKAGVKSARVRGKNLIELDAEELGRRVDRVQDIKNALAGR